MPARRSASPRRAASAATAPATAAAAEAKRVEAPKAAVESGATDYRGFVNLQGLFLATAAAQLAAASYQRDGLLVDLSVLPPVLEQLMHGALVWLSSFFLAFLSPAIVRWFVHERRHAPLYWTVHALFLLAQCALPVSFVALSKPSPLVGGTLAGYMFMLCLKEHSFFAMARDHRKREPLPSAAYGMRHFAYFLVAPTLCFDETFARTAKRRPLYILKEVLAAVCVVCAAFVIFSQFMIPEFLHLETTAPLTLRPLAEYLMRLAIPSMAIWLLLFYAYFHCALNAWSELLGYADREFYLDFWNSYSIAEFWRKWNRPVHTWLLRHVYIESMQSASLSKDQARLATFFLSAVAHEVIFSLAFGVLRPWFFVSMIAQLPLFSLNKIFVRFGWGPRWGNVLVWVSLFIGQPLIEVLYVCEWVSGNPAIRL